VARAASDRLPMMRAAAVLRQAEKLWSPPARTADGRTAAVLSARVRLIRARTALVEAQADLSRVRGAVEKARNTVRRTQVALAIARSDLRRYKPRGTQEDHDG